MKGTVKEHSRSFGSHLSQPARPPVLEIKLALRHGSALNNMAGKVLLDGVGRSDFQRLQSVQIVAHLRRASRDCVIWGKLEKTGKAAGRKSGETCGEGNLGKTRFLSRHVPSAASMNGYHSPANPLWRMRLVAALTSRPMHDLLDWIDGLVISAAWKGRRKGSRIGARPADG